MKVKIGTYRHRWISYIHTVYMDRKHGAFIWEKSSTRFENTMETVEGAIQWLYNKTINSIIDNQPTQKINVRIDRFDVYSMDNTLSHIIVPMLQLLAETKQGAPWVDDEDVTDELKSTSAPPKENDWDTDANHFKRWDYVINEMLWAFEQKARDDWEGDYYEYDYSSTNTGLGVKFLWEDKDGSVAHQKRMTNGFRLFGKYYENLWY